MKILLCHERFIFRFGVDRVLIILGKGLKELGHTVSVMGNRFDREILQTFASQIIEVPPGDNYLDQNEFTVKWLERTWNQHFKKETSPDIILVAGWPFFSAIPFFRRVCRNVVFSDHGMVPLDGYSGGHLEVLKKLKKLRQQYLGYSTAIIGVSDFIVNSQSRVDADGKVKLYSILNGADHMDMSIWSSETLHIDNTHHHALNLLDSLKREGRKTILCLGRWEPNCYKNSDAAFDIMPRIARAFPDCVLLILDDPSKVKLPSGLKNVIIPIGFPDDRELIEIMKGVDLGMSFSQWEGFNLLLAEMQWLGRPTLAFDIGAHPEVILHPWYLCKDNAEMAAKACNILSERGLDAETRAESLKKFRNYFTWSRAVQEYLDIFEKLINEAITLEHKDSTLKDNSFYLIVDVTNSSRDPANSGVIRVTRRLCRELQSYADPVFVVWNQETSRYVLPNGNEFQMLSQFNGPTLTSEKRLSPDGHRVSLADFLNSERKNHTWLLFPETMYEKHARKIRQFARERGIQVAAIFHDAIPVLHPELCKDDIIRDNHSDYMRGLAECDVVIPNSNFSAQCLKDFWASKNIEGTIVSTNVLPGEFGGHKRQLEIQDLSSKEIRILCVSTLEPRKNHLRLVKACLLIQERHPDLDWSLTLVGNRYAGAFDIADHIQDVAARNPRIKWLGIVDDATLHRLYEESTFTVYPSMIEGFGMPILESIWHGKPCICFSEGVMGELAADGGCLTTDVMDEEALYEAIYRLATDRDLLLKLSREAVNRKIKTWDEYVKEFISILKSRSREIKTYVKPAAPGTTWQEILYPNCICENWQMNDSERLAITALLSRLNPLCSIEVGTFKGGSLSLISQYSEMVFSIDIDPGIPEKFKQFKNASFLTGPSSVVLPLLLKELDRAGIPIDFILIDGDHSAEGVKRDITSLLSYVPKRPLFVIMHDSFNPECRRGMLEANWESSPYVDFVDLDFIPGRIVEDDSPFRGQMWGGLGLAYFSPLPRKKSFRIKSSAEMMFNKMANQMEKNIRNNDINEVKNPFESFVFNKDAFSEERVNYGFDNQDVKKTLRISFVEQFFKRKMNPTRKNISQDFARVIYNSIEPSALNPVTLEPNKMIGDQDIERITSAEDIKQLFAGKQFSPGMKDYLDYHAERFAFIIDLISTYIRKLNKKDNDRLEILDVGTPHLPTECIRHFFGGNLILRTIGLFHFSPNEIIDEHIHFDLNDAHYREKWIAPKEHDIILFAETIEHLYTSPKLVLSFIKSFLRPGGFLIIQTPNAVSISKRIAILNGSNPYEMIRETRDDPGHFREYTARELYDLGKDVGLTCEKIIYNNYWPQGERYRELEEKYQELRGGITIIFQR